MDNTVLKRELGIGIKIEENWVLGIGIKREEEYITPSQ